MPPSKSYITTTLNTTTASHIFPHTHLHLNQSPLPKKNNGIGHRIFFSKVQNSIINRCCGFLAVHYAIPRLHDTSLEQMVWGLQRSVVKKHQRVKKDPETRDAKIYKWSKWWSEKYLRNKWFVDHGSKKTEISDLYRKHHGNPSMWQSSKETWMMCCKGISLPSVDFQHPTQFQIQWRTN